MLDSASVLCGRVDPSVDVWIRALSQCSSTSTVCMHALRQVTCRSLGRAAFGSVVARCIFCTNIGNACPGLTPGCASDIIMHTYTRKTINRARLGTQGPHTLKNIGLGFATKSTRVRYRQISYA